MLNVPTMVKDALKSGMYQKNHRIKVLEQDGTELFTIDNNNLVDGSVSYDERLCTGDTLKFGLCEGSSLQFQYFGKDSILGKRLQCFIDAQYKDTDGVLKWYSIPMGFYDVEQCPMQFSTGIKKVTAYNKLKSSYLDEKVNDKIADIQSDIADDNYITAGSIVDSLLEGFKIEKEKQYSYVGTRNRNQGYASNVPFYINGSSTKYYFYIETQSFIYNLNDTKQLKVKFCEYRYKTRDNLQEIKEYIYTSCQNPATVWNNFVNSGLYQLSQIRAKKSPSTNYNIYYTFEKPSTKWDANISKFEDLEELEYMYGFSELELFFPINLYIVTNPNTLANSELFWDTAYRVDQDCIEISGYDVNDSDLILINKNNVPDVTLREFQTALFEMNCQFGQLDRTTDLFSGIELNNSRLLPADTLYPSNTLFPGGNSEHVMQSSYEKMWTDTQGVQKYKDLIITYKALNSEGQEEERKLERTVNADGTQNYNMSSNWLFKNLVWTDAQVGQYADAMVEKMQNVTWFPFEMWAAGLPYIETGDELEITTQNGTYTSYILTRTLKGIQDLHDTYINGTLDIF